MKKTKEDLIHLIPKMKSSGCISLNTPLDYYVEYSVELLSALFEEVAIELPTYQFRAHTQEEISEFLCNKEGYVGVIPHLKIDKDKLTTSYYELILNTAGILVVLTDRTAIMASTLSALNMAQRDFQEMIDLFKINESDEKLYNFFNLYVDNVKQTLITHKREDISVVNDIIINTYEWNSEIQELLNLERSGCFMFHGEPGCGKSTYIKYLAQTNRDKEFYVISLNSILTDNGIRYVERFLTKKLTKSDKEKNPSDIIFIIEDSERILMDRTMSSGRDSLITTEFLNILDGTSFGSKVKMIFTFNQKISKIDTAMTRKGRLLKSVEFTKLKGDTLVQVAEKMNIKISEGEIKNGLTVSDLIYHDQDNGIKQKTTIGFK